MQNRETVVLGRNEHGHTTFTFTGIYLTGAEEIERSEIAGYHIGIRARSMFMSTKADGYDARHRIETGQACRIVLMPAEIIACRTTEGVDAVAREFGYGKLLAGSVPRLRERISIREMDAMKVWKIVTLHDPIDESGNPSTFDISLRRVTQDENPTEFWSARDLMPILGYLTWRQFTEAVDRAKEACKTSSQPVDNHFLPASAKSSGGRPKEDYFLTRYACYLIAQNGDPRKPQIALAQAYFATHTQAHPRNNFVVYCQYGNESNYQPRKIRRFKARCDSMASYRR